MFYLRALLYVFLTLMGIAVTTVLSSTLLASTGFLDLLGLSVPGIVAASVVLALTSGVTMLFLGKDIALWSVKTRPFERSDAESKAGDLEAFVSRWSAACGLPSAPCLFVYEESDVNAFAVGWRKDQAALAVSSGLLARLSSDEAEAMIVHELVKLESRSCQALTLLYGMLMVFTVFPARMMALMLGTAVRTSEEETPSDIVESFMVIVLDLSFTLLGSLVVKRFARESERKADREAAARISERRLRHLLETLDKSGAGTNRDRLTAALSFGARVRPILRPFSFHIPYQARRAALQS